MSVIKRKLGGAIEMSNNKGLTLIEVLIATAILAVGLTSVLVVLNKSMSTMAVARQSAAALNLAREEMELIKNIKYPYPEDPEDDNANNNIDTQPSLDVTRSGMKFVLTRTVEDTLDDAGNAMKKEIRVDICPAGGTNPIVTLRTFIVVDGV